MASGSLQNPVMENGATIQGHWRAAAARLAAAGVPEPDGVAGQLVARALGCRPLELPLRRAATAPVGFVQALENMTARVSNGEPLQYVFGDTDFMGHLLRCDPRALIPRPETEELVAAALAAAGAWRAPAPCAADIGTGSGCVAIALALARPQARVYATDISAAALELAAQNAARLGAAERIRFIHADLWAPDAAPDGLDLIVSNPPYVPEAQWAALPALIREHEPRAALAAGPDGLAVIRRLIREGLAWTRAGGYLFMEIGEDQGPAVAELMRAAGWQDVAIQRDLAGHDRIARGRKHD